MLIDALVSFLPIGSNLALSTATAGVVYSNVIDLLGAGVGVAPPNIIGNATTFGSDQGIGVRKPQVQVTIGTAPTTGNSATLNVQFQGAPDTAVTYQPGTWQTLVETGAITVAQMTANAQLARFDFPPAFPVGTLPRYLRLAFQTAASTAFTAGTIGSAIVTMDRDDLSSKYAASNFTVA